MTTPADRTAELREQLRIAKEIEALSTDESRLAKLDELIEKQKQYTAAL